METTTQPKPRASQTDPARQVIRLVSDTGRLLRIPQPTLAQSAARANMRQIQGKPRNRPIRIVRRAVTPRQNPKALTSRTVRTPSNRLFRSERYRIIRPLNEGGSGTVYLAHDEFLQVDVALKLLPSHVLHDTSAMRDLRREATIAMELSHENIVKLHNLEIESGRPFLVMEYVQGSSLREIIDERGALSVNQVAAVCRSCGAALDYAHNRGVIHKDLKPENIMVNAQSVLKVVDFGTAIRLSDIAPESTGRYVEGTPCYMSPEQVCGLPLDERTDVYSLGLILYELLAGHSAFPLDATLADMARGPELALDDIPAPLAAVIARAISPDREHRWTGISAFCQAFISAAKPAGA